MDDARLDRALRSIGLACFADHYDIFADPTLDATAMVARLAERSPWTESGCRWRVTHARAIVAAGRSADALDRIASARVPASTAARAHSLAAALRR